ESEGRRAETSLTDAPVAGVDGRASDPRSARAGDDEARGLDRRPDCGDAARHGATYGRAEPEVLDPLLRGEGQELGTRQLHDERIREDLEDRRGGPAEVRGGHRGFRPRDLWTDRRSHRVERLVRV